jgi:signal transduction histidine kinase
MHVVYTSITHSLGGTIACESSPGQGVRFEIDFPLSHRSRDDDA